MISDDERREVARRLRCLRTGWSSGECYYTIIHALGLPDTSREDGGAALYDRLADLIEPTDGFDLDHIAQVCFECLEGCDEPEYTLYETILTAISRYKRGESGLPSAALVDRDSLLWLAVEMDVDAGWHAYVEDYVVYDYARRIRKALGVQDA